jgi:hypothetical protein
MYDQQLEGHLDPRICVGFEAIVRDFNAYPGIRAFTHCTVKRLQVMKRDWQERQRAVRFLSLGL